MSRYQGWEQPNEPGHNAAPYGPTGNHHIRAGSAYVVAYAVVAILAFAAGVGSALLAVWVGWIG